jgi:putative transposase
MARSLREEVEGGVFHVFARGNNRELIYRGDDDCALYSALLGAVVVRHTWRLMAFCLMENHVHLLIETPRANLGVGMQRLHSRYAQDFNKRHGRSGHVFQGRYGAVRVTADAQLWTVARYIAVNPVSAGICSEPSGWRWSSHAAVVGGSPPAWLDVSRLLAYFGAAGGEARRRYLAFVEDGFSRMRSGGR